MNATTKRNLKVTKCNKASSSREAVYLVEWCGQVVGTVSKFKDSRTATNPWKASVCVEPGKRSEFVGSFYSSDGGKQAAVDSLLVARDRLIDSGVISE